jgi:carbamate kinase
MPSTIVVALGGNALQQKGEASASAQERISSLTAKQLVPLIRDGHHLVIVHGNGPQVGNIVLHEEAINSPDVPTLPLDCSVAMSQGLIGYWLQQALVNELQKASVSVPVVTVVTRVLVDSRDPAFKDPTKPIGPFYATESEANEAARARGFVVKEDSGRGWRRVVPSPTPQRIVEIETVRDLVKSGTVVVTAGGGGIPVLEVAGGYEGIEAVIDKDSSAAVLADALQADELMILTTIGGAMVNFGTPEQQVIGDATAAQMRKYMEDGQFAAGSMLPKVESAIRFVEGGSDRRAVIASLDNIDGGTTGTVVHS